ncbi:MAG TPA: AAA family ATPase [Verrucomicrobiae bacterium]|nr:AAA family ATPase [Verrucomicrobiae bacterium]
MFLREIRIRNYSIHRDTTIKLSPLTVFVGPNGGGKSAIFEALLNFSMISRGNLRQAFGRYPFSFRATLHRGAVAPGRISFIADMCQHRDSKESLHYQIEYSQTGANEDLPNFTIFNERLIKNPGNQLLFDRSDPPQQFDGLLENDRPLFSAIRQAQIAGRHLDLDPEATQCAQQISRFNRFRLEPATLALPSRLPEAPDTSSSQSAPRIGYGGDDLAGTLYHMKEVSAPELESIKALIHEIEPNFQDFEFNVLGTDRVGFSVAFSDGRQSIAAPRLSSGILNFIGLVVLVCSPNRPAVMMIEEPENGLTPQAIAAFYRCLKSLTENADPAKRSQVLISSHSPFVICDAWNGEDRDFIHQVKVNQGRSQIRKFSEVIKTQGVQLGKDAKGKRTLLSLKTAEEVMGGRFS